MGLRYTLSEDGSYGIVEVCEDFDAAGAGALTEAVHAQAHLQGLRAVLLDARRARFRGSPVDHYLIVRQELPKYAGLERLAIAVLAAPGDRSHDFLQTVARNAGYPVRVFKDAAAASEWLIAIVWQLRARAAGTLPLARLGSEHEPA